MNTDLQSKDTQLSMLNAAGQRFDAADPAIKAPQFHGDPMAPEGGIVVFQIFGAGELLAAQDVRDRFRKHPSLLYVQQEVRHRRPWRGHDDDSTKAERFAIACLTESTLRHTTHTRAHTHRAASLAKGI